MARLLASCRQGGGGSNSRAGCARGRGTRRRRERQGAAGIFGARQPLEVEVLAVMVVLAVLAGPAVLSTAHRAGPRRRNVQPHKDACDPRRGGWRRQVSSWRRRWKMTWTRRDLSSSAGHLFTEALHGDFARRFIKHLLKHIAAFSCALGSHAIESKVTIGPGVQKSSRYREGLLALKARMS